MGAIARDGPTVSGKIILAHEPAFAVGALRVQPAVRQIIRDGVQQTIEPRVMRVLVALARARGGIVTRDELTDWCWDGRVVGEDAINRSLSRIRAIANGAGGGSFRIETIAKVGYRLVEGANNQGDPAQKSADDFHVFASRIDRRHWVAGAIIIGGAMLGGAAWWRSGHRPTPDAAELYRRGIEARSLGLIESNEQATAYFRQAVRADPNYPDAWGALARQLANHFGTRGDSALDRQSAEVRSAANRALALDPDQSDARGSLAVIQPYFRRWRHFERGLHRIVSDFPGQRQAILELCAFYANVGCWDDVIAQLLKLRRDAPLTPGATSRLVLAYWSAGRLEEADAESTAALATWPRFHGTWFSRMMLLTYGGRPEQAVAFGHNSDYHPSGGRAEASVELRMATAEALVSRNASVLTQVRERLLAAVADEIFNVPSAVRFLTALGETDAVFDLLDAYLLRRGRFAASDLAPIHPFTRLTTDFLFYQPSKSLWSDARFTSLMSAIGLDDYWRTAGLVPNHRRR